MATSRSEQRMKQQAAAKVEKATGIEKLRLKCLEQGCSGIKAIGRKFRIMDDNEDKTLDFNEFKKGLAECKITIDMPEAKQIFEDFDKDGSGSIDFDEFLQALRPPMSASRRKVINQAFDKLDKSGDGIVTIDDLKGVYNVKNHPKYINGEKDEDQLLTEYLKKFDSPDADGKVTREEFYNYYTGVSASIDQDAYFVLMMTNAWRLNSK